MKNMNEHLGFCSVAVGAFALALGLAACGDGESSNGPANDDDSSSSSVILSSSSSVILSDSEGSSSSKANWSYLNPDIDYGEFTDERDGQVYKTVTIGTQIWMAENLNYNTNDSYCYGNNASNCSKYGRLYTWSAAMNACPSGWHLPSDTEWNTLWTAVGRTSTAGTKLKSTSGWYSGNGTDSFGFAVLPAGYRNNDGNFRNEGDFADFWSSTENSSDGAYDWYFRYDDDNMYNYWSNKNYAHSVRCLRGSSPTSSSSVSYGTLTDLRDNQTYKTVTIGTQTWMAENLNYDDGNGGHCYELDNAWCEKNGRLYPWHVAMNACPSGWHLPSDDEWITLWTAVGGDSVAGAKLKSTDGWNEGGNGSDSFGFAVLPAGSFDYDIYFDGEGSNANYWSSSETDYRYPVFWYFSNEGDGVYDEVYDKSHGLSVRCLKD